MPSSTPIHPSGRSNIIAASIIAAAIIISALIITLPSLSLGLPPISSSSVATQFEEQVREKMKGKTHYHFSKKHTLQQVKASKVEYSAKNRTYIVEYNLDWGEGASTYDACWFSRNNADAFTGACDLGDNAANLGKSSSAKQTNMTLE